MRSILKKVKSSNLDRIGYIKELKLLFIKFLGGGLYTYHPFQASTLKRFEKASSKGTFFHEHIKNNPRYTVNKID